jgi:hypothetical protein
VIKSRRMRWAGYVVRMVRGEVRTGFWWEDLRKRAHLENSDLDGEVILRWIFGKWDEWLWTRLNWLRTGASGGHL